KKFVKLHSDSTLQDFLTEVHKCKKYTQLCQLVRIPTRKQQETYALGIISLFPSLREPFSTKGYHRQELVHNPERSADVLDTAFKQKIFNETQSLTSTAEIQCLLNAAGGQGSENGWHDL
uniref:Uncharacterized protein n=1 Tax=Cyprinus carpio carpio TaxID=630221 RepID=A0A9J8BNT6_CYPCA